MEKARNSTFASVDKRILHAFLNIAIEKSIADISVMEICKKAFIDRATFYRHFHGIWEIFNRIVDSIDRNMDELAATYDFNSFLADPKRFVERNAEVIFQDVDYMSKAVRVREISTAFADILKKTIYTITNNPTIPKMVQGTPLSKTGVTFFVGGFFYVCFAWLKGDLQCSKEELIDSLIAYEKLTFPKEVFLKNKEEENITDGGME